MTENKRFIKPHKNCRIIKNIQTDETATYFDTEDGLMFLKWLNNLSEENEQLKESVISIAKEYSEQEILIDSLQDENEQLKKELKRCKDWINSDKNDYELTLAFIKNKGYSLKDVLEYEKSGKKNMTEKHFVFKDSKLRFGKFRQKMCDLLWECGCDHIGLSDEINAEQIFNHAHYICNKLLEEYEIKEKEDL